MIRILPILIGASMAASPVLAHVQPGGRVLLVSLCGGGSVPIPIDGKPGPGDKPAACHAACLRKHPLDEDGELDG